MTARRRDNSPSARTMRSAVAYARLAAKAHRAGHRHAAEHYEDKSSRLRGIANRMRERETSR